jgi:transposase InsO family protein
VKRILTDNAWCYTHNRALRELLAARGIRHLATHPYRPQTNGKVERFHQTMEREWAKGMTYASHDARNRALPHWLRHYNERRPHSSLGGRPPISRVHEVRGQDS